MAPYLKPRERLAKEKFANHFNAFRPQAYQDPAAQRAISFQAQQTDKTNKDDAPLNGVRTISWNPLSTLVATGSSDRSVRVWNPDKPAIRQSTELKGHAAAIERVAFNPARDAELASVSADGVLRIWDVRSKACSNEVKGLGDACALAWAPDGARLLVANRDTNTLFVVDRAQPTPVAVVPKQPARATDIAFCWSGARVFVAYADGRVRILTFPQLAPALNANYEPEAGEPAEFALTGHSGACLAVALSPTGRTLATGGMDAVIALWDTAKWVCQRTLTSMAGPVRSLSFSWDGNYIVGGSTDGATELAVTQTESGEHVHTFKTAAAVPVVAWAPTRYYFAYTELGSLRIIGVDERRY